MGELKKVICKLCNMSFAQEKKFIDHLVNIHNITSDVPPFQSLYDEWILGQKTHVLCKCGCNVSCTWYGWKKGYPCEYIRGHNAKEDSVFNDPQRTGGFIKKRREGFNSGKYKVWNDGLTKETSDKIKLMSEKTSVTLKEGYETGRYNVSWQKGYTKETHLSLAKASKTHKEGYKRGRTVTWCKGKTKDEDVRLAHISEKIKQNYVDKREVGNRISVSDFTERVQKFSDKFLLVSDPNDYKTRRVERLQFKCIRCNQVSFKSLAMLEETPICFYCHPKDSKGQLELFDFVRSLSPDAVMNDRSAIFPKELDIWVPSRHFAIEYNGLYWHSQEVIKDQNYHQIKLDACSDVGISLFMVYEDEWKQRREIVMGMINHRLKQKSRVLDARKLMLRQLEKKEASNFFESNHLEGYARSIVSFGLCDHDSIMAAISLRRPFHKRYDDLLELARSCCSVDVNVRGWLGRLSKASLRYAKDAGKRGIMTYVDSRVGSGSGYESSGWVFDGHSGTPRFWWTDFINRYNRFKFKADKLKNLTQQQVAEENCVVPIFGCKNSRWILV